MQALAFPAAEGDWTISDDGLTCRLPGRVVSVRAPGALLRSVLSSCDGRTEWARVLAGLGRRWSAPALAGFLEGLAGEGALVDGRGERTFDDRPITAGELYSVLRAGGAAGEPITWLLYVLRALPGTGIRTSALQAGVYVAAPDERGLCQKAFGESLDCAWSAVSDPRPLTSASAIAVPLALDAGRDPQQMAFAMAKAAQCARDRGLGCRVVAAEVPADALARWFDDRIGGVAPCRGVILGAMPSAADCAREQESRLPVLRRAQARHAAPARFTYAAGPIDVGRAQVFATGRDASPGLAAIKAEAEAWERQGWAALGATVEAMATELGGAMDPRKVVAYEARQAASPAFPCTPFSRRRKYVWKMGHDTVTGAQVFLPAECVVASTCLPARRQRSLYTFSNTSGVAAWTDFEGALCGATLELIERDAFLRHWLCRSAPSQLAANHLPQEAGVRLRALEAMGLRVHVFRLASELAHVFGVFVQARDKPFTAITAAADFHAEVAIGKALDEAEGRASQALASRAKPLARASAVTSVATLARLYQSPAFYRRADFMAAGPPGATLRAEALCPDWPALKAALTRRGRQLLAFDLTPPHASTHQGRTPLHVVRAFVPGLIPIWFHHRLAPAGLPAYQAALARCGSKPGRAKSTFIHPFT